MTYLFNSRGQHIANMIREQLHSPKGPNIGHYMADKNIFIDMAGRYLGEIVHTNRLMYQRLSPHSSTSFGNYGNYGNAGNYGNPGNYGSIGTVSGYQDVAADWL